MNPLHPSLKPRRTWRAPQSLREVAIAGSAIAAITLLAYEAYQAGLYQPNVVARGSTSYVDENRRRVTAPTRQIMIARRSFWQVELAPGVWKDCGGDCIATLRAAMAASN